MSGLSTTKLPKYKRIPDFNPNTYPKKRMSEYTDEEIAEFARSIIHTAIRARTHIPVHVSNPNRMYMIYKAVFEEMLEDRGLTDDFREKLMDFGRLSSLYATPAPSLVARLDLPSTGAKNAKSI